MKKGLLVYTQYEANRNSFFVNQLLQNAKDFGLTLSLILKENISLCVKNEKPVLAVNGKEIEKIDFAIVRTDDYLLSFSLEQMGVKVFNDSRTSLICNDKYLTLCLASNLSIDVPDTILADKHQRDWQNLPTKFFPLVAKPLNQKGGKNVFLINDQQELLQKASFFGQRFLLQKPAKNLGVDTRVYVLDKRILLAVKRTSTTDFRSNYCLGGKATVVQPTRQQIDAVEKITQILGAHYVGIDFLQDGENSLLNEIEDVVGARMIYNLTDLNPAKELLKTIAEKL